MNKRDKQIQNDSVAQQLLKAEADTLTLARAEPTVANREAARAASAALSVYLTEKHPQGRNGFACRAGQRQHAEMRAMYPSHRK